MSVNMENLDPQMLLSMANAFKLLAEQQPGQKDVGTTHSAVTLHGPGGIFSTFGLTREVINASIQPRGLAAELPLEPSTETDPRFASITGVTDSSGVQPTEACADAPSAYLKGCNLTSRFGLVRYDTNTIEYDKVLQRYNRGDFMDLRLLGSMIHDSQLSGGMMPSDITEEGILNVATLAEMLVVGVQFSRELNRQMWQGNVSLTNEFPGLDYQIATGQLDADVPGKLCTALDSQVLDFGYSNITGTTRDIVSQLSSLMWYLNWNAQMMQLDPVEWVVVMRPTLWFELSALWPCRYLTNHCQSAAGVDVSVINDDTNVTLSTRMRNDMTIPINGQDYRVITDQGIYEYTAATSPSYLNAGQFASSLYVVPLTILSGFPATTRQYLNYMDPIGAANTAPFAQYRRDFWTDNGVFSWAYDGQYWCYKLAAKSEQRVVLRTPQLAGRIDHVVYEPTAHLRSWEPDSDYFADGGVSTRPAPRESYAVWSPAVDNVAPNR